jgi:hypothetical protein
MNPVPTLASPASMRTIAGLDESMMSRADKLVAGVGFWLWPHETAASATIIRTEDDEPRIMNDSSPGLAGQPPPSQRAKKP